MAEGDREQVGVAESLCDAEGGGEVLDREPGVASEAEDQPQVGRGHGLAVRVRVRVRVRVVLRLGLGLGGVRVKYRLGLSYPNLYLSLPSRAALRACVPSSMAGGSSWRAWLGFGFGFG